MSTSGRTHLNATHCYTICTFSIFFLYVHFNFTLDRWKCRPDLFKMSYDWHNGIDDTLIYSHLIRCLEM